MMQSSGLRAVAIYLDAGFAFDEHRSGKLGAVKRLLLSEWIS